jgi:hypothetical protein
MVKKEAILFVGGFPEGVKSGEDLLTWAKLACRYKIAFTQEVSSIYNFRSKKQLVTPRRAPDREDLIGNGLSKLLLENTNIPFLKEYVRLWYKMRLVLFVRLGMKKEAKIEIQKMKKMVTLDYRIYFWLFLNVLPNGLKRVILFQLAKFQK